MSGFLHWLTLTPKYPHWNHETWFCHEAWTKHLKIYLKKHTAEDSVFLFWDWWLHKLIIEMMKNQFKHRVTSTHWRFYGRLGNGLSSHLENCLKTNTWRPSWTRPWSWHELFHRAAAWAATSKRISSTHHGRCRPPNSPHNYLHACLICQTFSKKTPRKQPARQPMAHWGL